MTTFPHSLETRMPETAVAARVWELVIPAPAPWLNANSRVDRRSQTKDRQAWRQAGATWAHSAKLPKLGRAHLLAELRFVDNRHRDAHNLYPSLKALVDGMVTDYGLLPDDSHRYLIGPDLRVGTVCERGFGELLLTITELAAVA